MMNVLVISALVLTLGAYVSSLTNQEVCEAAAKDNKPVTGTITSPGAGTICCSVGNVPYYCQDLTTATAPSGGLLSGLIAALNQPSTTGGLLGGLTGPGGLLGGLTGSGGLLNGITDPLKLTSTVCGLLKTLAVTAEDVIKCLGGQTVTCAPPPVPKTTPVTPGCPWCETQCTSGVCCKVKGC